MIDLRSDTVTLPTAAMKSAMMQAELGDDVMGEDPTVNRLEEKVARQLGKEAAMFTVTATQANQIAVRCHCQPGDEVLINATGHIAIYEAGAPAVISGVTVRLIDSPNGHLRLNDLEGKRQPDDPHFVNTRLVCMENTSNMGGGYPWSIDHLTEISEWCHRNQLATHLDGARLFNACVAENYSALQAANCADTVTLCFSKGLGCPVGAMLVGTAKTIHQARRVRKMLGGGLRQAGIIAAAADHALDHHVERLQQDHQNAKDLAEGLATISAISIQPNKVKTNLIFLAVDSHHKQAQRLRESLLSRGISVLANDPNRIRLVTHLDISAADIATVIRGFSSILD